MTSRNCLCNAARADPDPPCQSRLSAKSSAAAACHVPAIPACSIRSSTSSAISRRRNRYRGRFGSSSPGPSPPLSPGTVPGTSAAGGRGEPLENNGGGDCGGKPCSSRDRHHDEQNPSRRPAAIAPPHVQSGPSGTSRQLPRPERRPTAPRPIPHVARVVSEPAIPRPILGVVEVHPRRIVHHLAAQHTRRPDRPADRRRPQPPMLRPVPPHRRAPAPPPIVPRPPRAIRRAVPARPRRRRQQPVAPSAMRHQRANRAPPIPDRRRRRLGSATRMTPRRALRQRPPNAMHPLAAVRAQQRRTGRPPHRRRRAQHSRQVRHPSAIPEPQMI